jgi:hypothetical protein
MRKTKRKHPPQQRKQHRHQKSHREAAKWSAEVTRKSDALDLEPNVFTQSKPADIASSLKRSAEASGRRKGTPFSSAMSMLNFYINRAGTRLSKARRGILERAKGELRRAFGRD